MLIVLEGLDGAGKSTQLKMVTSYLSSLGCSLVNRLCIQIIIFKVLVIELCKDKYSGKGYYKIA